MAYPKAPTPSCEALTADRVRELFDYSPETGIVTWRVTRSIKTRAGDRAGSFDATKNYRLVKVGSRRYYVHRIAWACYYGEWPSGVIDHINGETDDNRIENLRDASLSVNAQNKRRPFANNSSGYLGVNKERGKFSASISHGGRRHRLGVYETPQEAYAAYLAAKRSMHEGCTI